eukprot:scaffold42454_cov14-Tisochrysis_lutea.AAC.1
MCVRVPAGGRRDPSRVRVGPISSTVNDRFAANMRKSLRRFGVNLNEPFLQCAVSSTLLACVAILFHSSIAQVPLASYCVAAREQIMCVWSDEPLERKSLAMTAEKSRFK